MEKMNPSEKFLLTVKEASQYFGLGEKRIRLRVGTDLKDCAYRNGERLMIVRERFEKRLLEEIDRDLLYQQLSDAGEMRPR